MVGKSVERCCSYDSVLTHCQLLHYIRMDKIKEKYCSSGIVGISS